MGKSIDLDADEDEGGNDDVVAAISGLSSSF
jgi:hypothetical protein